MGTEFGGVVGHIPVTSELSLSLKPKVALKNLFHMLEHAYRLKSLRFLSGLMSRDSLAAYYQQLAKMLARARARAGTEGSSIERMSMIPTGLPYVRGQG
ncbi:MAG: hypothetical protein MZV63_40325 [Marinilabiliales bacterium]|nr:hypothetical protein [Marinilabiliales bacterium]